MSWLSSLIGRKAAPRAELDREQLDTWLRTAYDHAARGDHAEAQRIYRRLLEHDPRDPDALYFLGEMALADGRDMEAVELFRQAIEVRSNDAAFWFGLGAACFHQRRLDEAAEAFRSGLALQPENTAMRINLFATLIEAGRGDEAREEMERMIASGAAYAQLFWNLGSVYREQARVEEAIGMYRRAIELAPDNLQAFTNLLLTLNYSEHCDAATLLAEHRRFGARFARPFVAPQPDRTWPRRLRVGYISPDFRAHVVGYFIEPILANHDSARFEIFCYHNHRSDDAMTGRLRGLAEHWRDGVHLSDAELADCIRRDRIDILVDLAGQTGENRLGVLAAKPAPLQATYLGYPNTTGLSAVDYRISDARADPPGEADRASVERLLRPWPTYFCYRPRRDCPDAGPLTARAAGHITFGCFNNLPKISAAFLDAAARVLAAVPGSRLMMKSRALSIAHVADRLRERFVRAGIDLARVDLRDWEATVQSHLAAYRSIDIALDSFPYNGATTTCEALWMGVPVVTFAGDRHAGRMGSSLLHAVGLGELVAEDVDGYVAKCVALAADLRRLEALRSGLRARMRQSPLMDETGLTRALERCYTGIWEREIRPEPPPGKLGDEAIAAVLGRASELRAAGKKLEAEEACKEALQNRPDHLAALTLLWDLSYETGNPGVAVDWLRRAIAASDEVPQLHYMMGYSLLGQGNPADAAASLRKALALDPGLAKAHNNLGCALEAMGQLQEAAQCYRRAAVLDPKLADPLYNLGNAQRQLGQFGEGIENIERALSLDNGRADWHCNLGELLVYRLQLDEAVRCYDRALEIDPRNALAHAGRAEALQELGRAQDAESDIRRAMELQPGNERVHSHWLLSLLYRRGEEGEAMLEEHRSWAKRHARGIGWQAARAAHETGADRRLNIGYVSADFKRHSVASFVESVLAAHDRSRFKVFCYSNVALPDAVTQRIHKLCEEWRDISRVNDDGVAERVRADRIDILVDLAGHTGGGRMLLFARKPAPVQVTWLGYPNTTGLAAMDYRLTDSIADPEGATERFHVEKLVRLANGFLCYRPPSDSPQVGELPSLRAGHVTFGCFNHLPKLTPEMIALWARLLGALPGARLLLKSFGLAAQSARRALRARFAQHGIGAERLELCGPVDALAGHLGRYNEVDIALDVFPYNGTTTTCEALWMGVPVVSLAGRTHASRVGASLLHCVGLSEFVAQTPDQYLDLAAGLARDPARLAALRAGLRERMRASPLLDAQGFTRDLEAAYRNIWAAYRPCATPDISKAADDK